MCAAIRRVNPFYKTPIEYIHGGFNFEMGAFLDRIAAMTDGLAAEGRRDDNRGIGKLYQSE